MNYFHGTDKRIISMDSELRVKYRDICIDIADELRPYFPVSAVQLDLLEQLSEGYEDPNIIANLSNALIVYDRGKTGDQRFQYDAFYLTTSALKACNYAKRAWMFGEIGMIAYRMYDAAIKFGLNPVKMQSDIKTFLGFINGEAHPIVCIFNDIDRKNLLTETGEIVFDDALYDSFRYNDTVDFDKCKIKSLPDFLEHDYENK